MSSSFQSLIEGGGDCGAANPVVELARQFTQSTSSAAAISEDPTTSLIRDIHHPETLVGQQGPHHQQQQPIGSSFSAASQLLNSSRSSVQQLERQRKAREVDAHPFDMNVLLEQMREMDSAMERAMKRSHEDHHDLQDIQDTQNLEDLGAVEGDEPVGKLKGTGDPLLSSATLDDLDSGWEDALEKLTIGTYEAGTSSLDFGSFGSPSAADVIDESWEEALLATVGVPATLPGGANKNWVDDYFRTLDAKIDGIEAREEAKREAERQEYRRRAINTEDNSVKDASYFGDSFSTFFQSVSSTIDQVDRSKTSSQLPRGVRAEMTFNLSELVSDQEERLMNMLLSGAGGGDLQEEDQDESSVVAPAATLDPDQMLNLDVIGREEESKSSQQDFKMPQSLLSEASTSKQESLMPEEKFFYENQFDDMEFWMKLAEDWEHSSNPLDLEAVTGGETKPVLIHESLEELLKPDHLHHYHFVLQNPFLRVEEEEEAEKNSEAMKTEDDVEDYIARGLAKLHLGDIPAAILLFEAAAATAPDSARAWLLLGTAQAKNENDRKAIGAMKRCLALEPDNLEALLCLAVSFTNESQSAEACTALREWLAVHPKYRGLLEEAETQAQEAEKAKEEEEKSKYMGPTPLSKRWGVQIPNSSGNIFTSGLFERVKGVFIQAATETSAEDQQGLPDADVQCGLGVLLSLSGDYEKAADCFRTAVAVCPQDHTLWNRLGATLANGGRSEEAMAAYREALTRYPGYIRARHNLAIACLMLGAEREAVGHLLSILNLQTEGTRTLATEEGGKLENSALAEIIANPSAVTSQAVWSMLRTALLALGREDLFPAVSGRQLEALNREFEFGRTGEVVEED